MESRIELISSGKLADRLGVSRRTVWRWTKEGRLPKPRKLGDNTTRYDVAEVKAWIEDQPFALTDDDAPISNGQ